MFNELKSTVINMKNLSQDIEDPLVVGAGDANGRNLRIIFTQRAAAQLTPQTKVYLSWKHQEKNIKGYNVFTEIKNEDEEDFPPTWEIHYPQSMLWEGNVLACIQLVDDVSIATSTNFVIHVLSDPNEYDDYVASSDYSDFKKAVITLNSLADQMNDQIAEEQEQFNQIVLEFENIKEITDSSKEIADEAKAIAEEALEKINSHLEETEDNVAEELERLNSKIDEVSERHDEDLTFIEFI